MFKANIKTGPRTYHISSSKGICNFLLKTISLYGQHADSVDIKCWLSRC